MQCYPSYAMYWTVLAAANWTTGQVNCQGQLGRNIAAYQGKLGDTHTYIYIIYISGLYINYIYVCVSLSHSTDYEGPPLKHPIP